MRSGSGTLVVTVLSVILFGCLALGVECRSLLLEDGGRGRKSRYPLTTGTGPCHNDAAGSVNSTLDEESELTLVFCIFKGVLQCGVEEPCYCCQAQQQPQCYCTVGECRAKCPVCNPRCPPETAAEGRPSSLHVSVNGSLY